MIDTAQSRIQCPRCGAPYEFYLLMIEDNIIAPWAMPTCKCWDKPDFVQVAYLEARECSE